MRRAQASMGVGHGWLDYFASTLMLLAYPRPFPSPQTVLYNLFDWPGRRGSRLSIIGVANTMDLPERLHPRIGRWGCCHEPRGLPRRPSPPPTALLAHFNAPCPQHSLCAAAWRDAASCSTPTRASSLRRSCARGSRALPPLHPLLSPLSHARWPTALATCGGAWSCAAAPPRLPRSGCLCSRRGQSALARPSLLRAVPGSSSSRLQRGSQALGQQSGAWWRCADCTAQPCSRASS